MKTLPSPILAIDTGQADGSVAVVGGGHLAARRLGAARDHARLLTAAIRDVMADTGCRFQDLAGIAVVRGPGSFTGLRVGVATAKTIAWSSSRPLVGVSAFETVARGAWSAIGPEDFPPSAAQTRSLAVAFEAGRGEVSAAVVTIATADGHDAFLVGEARLTPLERWLDGLGAGSLVVPPSSLRSAAAARGLRVPDRDTRFPDAVWTAHAAADRFGRGDQDDPFGLVPDYMRPSYAEEPPRPMPDRA